MDQLLNCAEKLLRAGGPVNPASGQKEKEPATDASEPSDTGECVEGHTRKRSFILTT